ncbi:MAG: N-methyl-L-tryptophan oxidase [Anaerolineae bacterium]|jgi:monomeric sarcosine oxidase|nr:N-methyl-L-tryptophan oxidase [Anaerolineae bacterium]
MPAFDAIVVGAGAMGSAAAYYLSRAGQRVLLLEQFDLTHERGSSQDHSRIIRYTYNNPAYITLVTAAYKLWFALEEASGEQLYYKTGGLNFGAPDHPSMRDTLHSVQRMKIPHEVLTPQETRARYPQFTIPEAMQVIFEPESGILTAARCVAAHLRLAQQHGAVIRPNSPVTAIQPQADSVTVHTADAVYSAARLILAGGAWTNDLLARLRLPALPLRPMRVQLAYFQPPDITPFSVGRFPTFIAWVPGIPAYGMPSIFDSGVKVAFHGGETRGHVSEIDYTPDEHTIAEIRAFCRGFLPGADTALKQTRICLYTMTPDEDFILDQHPEYPHILYTSPCSGHGFKFSTLIGSILCDLALTGSTPHDISLFRAARFTANA